MLATIIGLALLYLVLGLASLRLPPMSESLRRLRWDMGYAQDMRRWLQEQASDIAVPPAIPRWRVRGFLLTVHAAAVLGWPVFVPGMFNAWHQARKGEREWQRNRPWQRLTHKQDDDLHCSACGHEERLPGRQALRMRDTGKYTWAKPYQCLDCRKLIGVENTEKASEKRCDCGGELGCDHITLCPRCGSDALEFDHHGIRV